MAAEGKRTLTTQEREHNLARKALVYYICVLSGFGLVGLELFGKKGHMGTPPTFMMVVEPWVLWIGMAWMERRWPG